MHIASHNGQLVYRNEYAYAGYTILKKTGLWRRLQSKEFFVHYLNSTQRSTFKFCTNDLHNMPMVQVIFRCILVGLQKGRTTFKGEVQ